MFEPSGQMISTLHGVRHDWVFDMTGDIAFAGAAEQARLLGEGAVTAPALLETYLDRIDRLNPVLRAYRVVLEDSARAEAAAAQERLDAGERLPLLGVPVAIKDDVDVAGEVTARGSGGHGPPGTSAAGGGGRPGSAGHPRRGGGAPVAGGRRGDHRQDQCARADDLPVHRVTDVRRDPQPVEPAAQSGRKQRRERCRGRRRTGPAGAGIRWRRLDSCSVQLVWP